MQVGFVKAYTNSAKQLINLAFYVKATGVLRFELIDALGQQVMQEPLGATQNFAQFSTGNLSNGVYHWILKDTDRIIKTGKVVVVK